MVRNWFNLDEGMEQYLSPARNGRNRGFDVESVVRLKLLCLWRYEKNFSTKRIHEMIYGENSAMNPREWLPAQVETLVGQHMRKVFGVIQEYQRTVKRLEGEVSNVSTLHQELNELKQERCWEQEALLAWQEEGDKRYRRQLMGLVKVEDTQAKERFVQDYIASRKQNSDNREE